MGREQTSPQTRDVPSTARCPVPAGRIRVNLNDVIHSRTVVFLLVYAREKLFDAVRTDKQCN